MLRGIAQLGRLAVFFAFVVEAARGFLGSFIAGRVMDRGGALRRLGGFLLGGQRGGVVRNDRGLLGGDYRFDDLGDGLTVYPQDRR